MEYIFQWKRQPEKRRGGYTSTRQNSKLLKTVTKDKEGHYTVMKESIQKKDLAIRNISPPNIRAPKYIKQIWTDMKGEISINTGRVGEYYIMLLIIIMIILYFPIIV